nr:hypothetical protein [uncultured Desulfobacter sp.]
MSVKVIYIVGAGRSGSTVIDITLNNHPQVVGVGELSSFFKLGIIEKEKCSCGAIAEQCDFFSGIYNEFLSSIPEDTVDYYLSLQEKMERIRFIPMQFLKMMPKKIIHDYIFRTELFYKIIQKHSDKEYILDSTKGPGKLLALSRCADIKLFPVHLVRHCSGFVDSKKKRQRRIGIDNKILYSKPESTVSAVLYWYGINLITLIFLFLISVKQSSDFSIILYERLIKKPKETYGKIMKMIPLDLKEIVDKIETGGSFRIGHVIGGNRLKYNREIKVDNELKPLQNIDQFGATLITLCTLPLKLVYNGLYRLK